jgi:hypothetical protein
MVRAMKWIFSLNTGIKLAVAFGITILLTMLIGVIGLTKSNELAKGTKAMYDDNVVGLVHLAGIVKTGLNNRIDEEHFAESTEKSETERLDKKLTEDQQKLQQFIDSYRALLPGMPT